MRQTISSTKFRKDYRRCIQRGLQTEKIRAVVVLLENDEELPQTFRPHKLGGYYSGFWECHIASDWLLIYSYPDTNTLKLERTGTHSDLF